MSHRRPVETGPTTSTVEAARGTSVCGKCVDSVEGRVTRETEQPFLWGVIEGGLGSFPAGPAQAPMRAPFGSDKYYIVINCACIAVQDDLFPIFLQAIPSLTFSLQIPGITKHLRPIFMSCPTKICESYHHCPQLPPQRTLCTVSLSAIPAIIQTIDERMSQGVDIQL